EVPAPRDKAGAGTPPGAHRRQGMTMTASDEVLASQSDEVRRDLSLEVDGSRQHAVQTLSQSYPTTTEDLWEACTRAERLARWFAPVTGELRLGGRYQVEGNASGEVVACDPPHCYTVTWEFGGDSSRLTVTVAP